MKKFLAFSFFAFLSLFLVWCAYGEPIPQDSQDAGDILRDASISDGGFDLTNEKTMPIFYRNGKVMTKPAHVYIIWYGGWVGKESVSIVENFINNFSNSKYYKINTSYYQETTLDSGLDVESDVPPVLVEHVTPTIVLSKEIFMPYLYGTSLSQPDIQEIFYKKILDNELPLDSDGIYLIITDKNVSQNWMLESFCNDYCGWHTFDTLQNTSIKYGFIGDPEKCPLDCSDKISYLSLKYDHSPNNDWSGDGMVSIIAHEISEMVTDPELNAWKDAFGRENADKCAWTYKGVYVTQNNSVANMKIGNKEYLVQANWALYPDGGQGCALEE